MRTNVYSQELTDEVVLRGQLGEAGQLFSAVMFVLRSGDHLHDDDKSGVTFWLPRSSERRERLAATFEKAAQLVRSADPEDV